MSDDVDVQSTWHKHPMSCFSRDTKSTFGCQSIQVLGKCLRLDCHQLVIDTEILLAQWTNSLQHLRKLKVYKRPTYSHLRESLQVKVPRARSKHLWSCCRGQLAGRTLAYVDHGENAGVLLIGHEMTSDHAHVSLMHRNHVLS